MPGRAICIHLGALALAGAAAGCQRAPDLGGDIVAVSDESGGRIVVLGGPGERPAELKTGRRPRGMAVTGDGKLWVAASEADRLELWRPGARRPERVLGGIPDPERLALAPDRRTIYVANENDSSVAAVDTNSGEVRWRRDVGPEPEGIAVAPDGGMLVATAEGSSTAHFIAAVDGRLLASELVGTRPRAALFLPRRHEIWVSSELRGSITVFATASLRPIGEVDLVPAFPNGDIVQAVEMTATRDGRRVFVAMGRGNRVAEIDPATRRVVRSFPSGKRTWGLALSPDERRLYAVAGLSGDLTVIDLVSNKVAGTIEVGGKPWGVAALRP